MVHRTNPFIDDPNIGDLLSYVHLNQTISLKEKIPLKWVVSVFVLKRNVTTLTQAMSYQGLRFSML